MRRPFFLIAAVLTLGLFAAGAPAHAQSSAPEQAPKVQARLISEHGAVQAGHSETIALTQKIEEGWHTYWKNPGEAGAATEIEWQLPPGWTAGEIQWPWPERLPYGPFINYGYTGETALLVDLTAPPDAPAGVVTIPAKAHFYVCKDICIPEEADVSVTLNVGAMPAAQNPELFAKARAALPKPAPWNAVYRTEGGWLGLLVEAPELAAANPRSVTFFPDTDGKTKPSAPVTVRTAANGLILDSAPGYQFTDKDKPALGQPVTGVLVLTDAGGVTSGYTLTAAPGDVPAPPPAPVAAASGVGLVQGLLFAFLGGLILNLMPCVLPVLSMKALAVASHGAVPGAAKREALAYGAGVVLSFVALAVVMLALRAGGSAVGWGYQLQQPVFVAGLALLMFAVGLNLAGLFEIGAGRLAGAGSHLAERGGMTGSLFTGVLAVVVATPCTAPFMAAALGFAATEPPAVALGIFVALALGFAAPFVALGFSPALLKHLPRPGTWMITFKQVLAFPMFGAAIWLVWVLSQQVGPDGLFAMLAAALALAFALWAYGASARMQGRGKAAAYAVAVLGLVGAFVLTAGVARSPAPAAAANVEGALGYVPFSAARLASLRAENKPVFVNATAAWCITCLVNERVALSSGNIKQAFARAGVVALKADWTNQNPEITALLSEYGRSGVPLYLYFPKGARSATVLPQILTEETVLNALQAGT